MDDENLHPDDPSLGSPIGGGEAAAKEFLQLAMQQAQALTGGSMSTMPVDPSTKHARKIYVGNLPADASETSISSFFNETLASLLPNKPAGNVVIGCYLNAQRRFGFVEHRSIEEANFTLSLDGILFGSLALKLRRPQDYNASLADAQLGMEMQAKGGNSAVAGARQMSTPAVPAGDLIAGALGIVSTTVEDSPNKVFIGGLPHHLGENEVKGMLSNFGTLKSFHLVKLQQDTDTDKSKGFAFCEWRDSTTTDMACQALNGMKIGERVLNVRRALPHAVHKAAVGVPEGCGSFGQSTEISDCPTLPVTSSQPFSLSSVSYSPPVAVSSSFSTVPVALSNVNATIGPPPPTSSAIGRISRILQITNMMPTDADMEEINRIVGEAKSECQKVGEVRDVEYYNGQVLVAFSTTQAAVQAMKALQGRQFDGRLLNCTFAEASPRMKSDAILRIISEVEEEERRNKRESSEGVSGCADVEESCDKKLSETMKIEPTENSMSQHNY